MDFRLLCNFGSEIESYAKLILPQYLLENRSGVSCAIAVIFVISRLLRPHSLDAFPTVGPSIWLAFWYAVLKRPANVTDVLQEGYKNHKLAPFKIVDKDRKDWIVVMSHPKHIEELLGAPEENFSIHEAANDRINFSHTLGRECQQNFFHIAVIRADLTRNIRAHLTRNISVLYPDIRNEVIAAFDDTLVLEGNEWKSIPVLTAVEKIVCRVCNGIFVGPLCRDPDWVGLVLHFTHSVATQGLAIGKFPKFMRPFVALFFKDVAESMKRGEEQLRPTIEERLRDTKEYGNDWAGKPIDLLSWLLDKVRELPWAVKLILSRMLVIDFVLHSPTFNFAHALFYLAANPQYVEPLQEEVESIVEREGWSKASLSKMVKVDNFLKECLRLEGTTVLTLERKAVKDYTFSDGTFIPKGTVIGIPIRCIHHNEQVYDRPTEFEPFRFANMRDEGGGGEESGGHSLASATTDFLAFGYGMHACPGRAFVANALKTMLAHVVMSYDIKLEDGVGRPPSWLLGRAVIPDPRAKILFRKRID